MLKPPPAAWQIDFGRICFLALGRGFLVADRSDAAKVSQLEESRKKGQIGVQSYAEVVELRTAQQLPIFSYSNR